jgi:hypothetical protein
LHARTISNRQITDNASQNGTRTNPTDSTSPEVTVVVSPEVTLVVFPEVTLVTHSPGAGVVEKTGKFGL